jgi:hypothetical protein
MGNSNTSERETHSSNQELIEINKLAQQYLTLLFKDDTLATREYDESKEEFLFRSRPSMYLFDNLTFEQKKILVSEFYNINQELKYKNLNTKDKLKYLQHYLLLYKQCHGVSKYSNGTSLNLNSDFLRLEKENEKLKVENERLKLEKENERLKAENERLKLEIKNREPNTMNYEELFDDTEPFSNVKKQPNTMNYEELFDDTEPFSNVKKQPTKINYDDIIKITAHKLAEWDNYMCINIPRNIIIKSPVYYKDMLEDNINKSDDNLLIESIINDLYIEIDNIGINCYTLKNINESQAMLMLNQIFIKDKYYKNNKINNIIANFIPNALGVRGETNRNGHTTWYGLDNYISIIKQRINIFREFYCKII